MTYEDTYNTLRYADRAKKIKIKLKKNVLSVDFQVGQYAKIVEDLKVQLSECKVYMDFTNFSFFFLCAIF